MVCGVFLLRTVSLFDAGCYWLFGLLLLLLSVLGVICLGE